jgi:bleomycin hydrolase
MNRLFCILFALMLLPAISQAQEDKKESAEGYAFTLTKELKHTPVKDQYRSGTCWSFSGLSFLESELIRMGKGEHDLSDMFVVRMAYSDKALSFVRMQGKTNFGGGGAFHDVTNAWKKYGIVPESAYSGLVIQEEKHIHGEMDEVFGAYVKAVVSNPNKKLTPVWHKGFEGLLDAYLGEVPEKFTYNGKEYTPQSFSASLGLNPDDYVEITSYTHHPFYSKFVLELPDNWAFGQVYNVPLDEMMEVIDYALENDFTVAWASDVSEKGFAYRKGVAVVPTHNTENLSGSELLKWQEMSKAEKEAQLYKLEKPGPEKVITQEARQLAFDNYETTDDHGMHFVGIAKDQHGTKYYYVKNSWADSNEYKGYFYASVPFVQYKTTSIMIHKDAVPKKIAKKLGL